MKSFNRILLQTISDHGIARRQVSDVRVHFSSVYLKLFCAEHSIYAYRNETHFIFSDTNIVPYIVDHSDEDSF